MTVATQPHPALRWDGRRLAILDQTRLPGAEVWLALEGAADTAQAIRRLVVRVDVALMLLSVVDMVVKPFSY